VVVSLQVVEHYHTVLEVERKPENVAGDGRLYPREYSKEWPVCRGLEEVEAENKEKSFGVLVDI
jgi:hypothetical protein